MISVLSFVAVFLSFILIAIVHFRPMPSKGFTVPGLKPVDSKGSGNIPDIKAAGSLHEFLMKLHKQYGPIASFWFGPKYTVSVASPDLLKEFQAVFDRPPQLFKLFEPVIGPDSILYSNGIEARKRRKLTDPGWSHDMLRLFCEYFNEVGEEVARKLASLPENEHIPLSQLSLDFAIKCLAQTSLGSSFKNDDMCHRFSHNIQICWHEIEQRLDGYVPEDNSERQRKFNESLKTVSEMVKHIVKLRQENPPKPHERVFIDILMDHTDIFPESKLVGEVLTHIIGGFHTTGYLLAWTLYFFATHNDVQEKVFQEVISVVGRQGLIGPDDLGEFHYMKQVLNESMRLSAITLYTGRVQHADIQLSGYSIPKDTPVITSLGVVAQDETVWPFPNTFDPERFSSDNVTQRHPFAFQPFGLPARRCPGYRFAYTELTVCLGILIRNFSWSLVEGQVVERKYRLLTSPKEEIWAQVQERP